MALGKPVFTRKNGTQKGGRLYKWSPIPADNKAKGPDGGGRKYYCTAVAGSQGEDWKTTYSYVITVVNGIQKRIAYVACDYVA